MMKNFLSGILLMVLSTSHWVFAGHPSDKVLGAEMMHGTIEVSTGARVPEVGAELYADVMDGYNLQLMVKHFEIIPPIKKLLASASGALLEGHAHLYVNGVKVQRVYGRYLHLPEKLFRPGINTITVSLNDHKHATWTVKEVEIQTTLTIHVGREPLVLNHYSSSPILKRPH